MTSLMPIHMAKSVLSGCHGKKSGREAYVGMNSSLTCCLTESTVGRYCGIKAASTVAPPYAKLTVPTKVSFQVVVRKPTQFGPFCCHALISWRSRTIQSQRTDEVYPGYSGLPKGFSHDGCVPLTSNPVVVYESPNMNMCFMPDQPGQLLLEDG